MAFESYFNLPEIPGEATKAGYEQQIKLSGYGLGASNTASHGTGGAGAGTGMASVSTVHMKKEVDKSSPLLFMACCQGMHYPTATLTVVKSGGGEDVPYMVIEMSDIFISSYQQSGGDGAELVRDDLEVSYGSVSITYTGQADTGAFSDTTVGTWNVHTGTP